MIQQSPHDGRKIQFGTDGWRAVMGEEMTEETVANVGFALLDYLRLKNVFDMPVAIGYDGRKNSRLYAGIFAEILAAGGIPVFLSCGIIPTPVLSFTVKKKKCSSGVMITASHNPPHYNGIKFKGPYGGPFLTEETGIVESFLSNVSQRVISSNKCHIVECDFLPEYLASVEKLLDIQSLESFPLQFPKMAGIIVDSMGGAGGTIIEDFLNRYGWRVQTIFGEPEETFFGRSPEPIEKNLQPLLYNVQSTSASLGLATDGDADRCSIVCSNGEWLNAQETIIALMHHLFEIKGIKGGIVKTASVTDKIRILAKEYNQPVFDVHVGFKYITEAMLKNDIAFGGEESGGFGFGNHLPERDGILSNLFFVELMAKTQKPLPLIINELRERLGKLFYKRIDQHYLADDRLQLLPKLKESNIKTIGSFEVQNIFPFEELGNLTGLKFLCGDCRWLLLRTSQTEPMLRLYAEGRSEDDVASILEDGKRLLGL